MKCKLIIQDLALWTRLGVSKEERAVAQEVRVHLELHFDQKPTACDTDALTDTLCYAEICHALRTVSEGREFQTVEHLAESSLQILKRSLPATVHLKIQIHKLKPPIPGLLGGVIFEMNSEPTRA